MKFFLLSIIFSFLLNHCIQKQNDFEDRQTFLVTLISTGAPKSFGLDLQINNRIGRGCETRVGNMTADAMAWKANALLGFYGSGSIRDDYGIKNSFPNAIIPKGTVPTLPLLKTILPFDGGDMLRTNMRAYRIKQALEHSVSRLNSQAERNTDNMDADGPTHGNCWLNPNVSGSGRFLQLNSKMQIEVNPTATASVVSGTGAARTLLVVTQGRRVTRIIIDGLLVYNNSTGDINSGWANGVSSCTIKGTMFTSSAACNFYSVGVEKFQFNGADSNPALSPDMTEVSNDGSIIVLETGIGSKLSDADIVYEYIQTFTTGPLFPKISNRIIMP